MPDAIWEVVERCWDQNPERRPGAQEVVDMLMEACESPTQALPQILAEYTLNSESSNRSSVPEDVLNGLLQWDKTRDYSVVAGLQADDIQCVMDIVYEVGRPIYS